MEKKFAVRYIMEAGGLIFAPPYIIIIYFHKEGT
jgi:hypothetical protein